MVERWFIVPYKTRVRDGVGRNRRYCAMDDFSALIRADGGTWAESEILGNHATVLVKASQGVLDTLATEITFTVMPNKALDEPMTDLENAKSNEIITKLVSIGYPLTEIHEKLATDMKVVTLRDVLGFSTQRRTQPRYDEQTDAIVFDGEIVTPKPIGTLDNEVKGGR